jgi:hypothetical protein
MVSALRDTSGVAVLDKQSAREMLKWFDNPKGEPPQERLADFRTLLRRSRRSELMDAHPLKLSKAQADDIVKLHTQFRNEFAHFVPKGWSIEKAGLSALSNAWLS